MAYFTVLLVFKKNPKTYMLGNKCMELQYLALFCHLSRSIFLVINHSQEALSFSVRCSLSFCQITLIIIFVHLCLNLILF